MYGRTPNSPDGDSSAPDDVGADDIQDKIRVFPTDWASGLLGLNFSRAASRLSRSVDSTQEALGSSQIMM